MPKKHSMTVTIPFKPPKTQHNYYENGQLMASNQFGEDRKIKLPVIYTVKSDTWWADQKVTNKQGNIIQIMDVFEYGEYYVILTDDGSKLQVIHDQLDEWHVV